MHWPQALARHNRSISIIMLAAMLLAAGAVFTLIAQELFTNRAGADGHVGGATVRIAAIKSDAGAVHVALQQHQGDEWSERQHPQFNKLRADAPANRWLHSSPIELAVTAPDAEERPLLCVVAHGHIDDPFWQQVRGYMYQSSLHLDAHLRFHSSPDGESQAAAITQCSSDGAVAIAATLADPGAVRDALLAARDAGAWIVTFNSGASHAQSVGSELHIALDDQAAGRFIGERLNAQEITGVVACLIHERQNVGLEERCDGIEQSYEGTVRRIPLPTADEAEALQQAIREVLMAEGDDSNDVIVTLNAGTSFEVLRVATAIEDELGPVLEDKRLLPMGSSPERGRLRDSRAREGRTALDVTGIADAGEAQGYFVVSALMHIASFPLAPITDQPTVMLITPWELSVANVFTLDPAELTALILDNRTIIAEGAKVEPINLE